MRIYHLFRDAPFDADHIELMSSAFEDVSKQLGLGRREDAIRDIVAKAILECAQRGIRDPIEMREVRARRLADCVSVASVAARTTRISGKETSISLRDRTKTVVRR